MTILILLFYWLVSIGALVAPLTTKGTTVRSRVRAQIRDYIRGNGTTGLGDSNLGGFLKTLESTAADDDRILTFNPNEVAGTWRVIHAPHIESLSTLFAQFTPIEYHLTPDLKMTSCVKYTTRVGNSSGWLCTSGFYTVEASTGNVKIVWDNVWWNADDRERPTPPEEGSFSDAIQKLGKIGFIEPLSFFPVRYVDKEFAIFQFFGFTISAMKVPTPKPGILVRNTARS